jgi:soluble lytic murein transglycosylase
VSKRPWIWLVAALVAIDALGAFWWYRNRHDRRFDAQIIQAARQHGIDPALVKAVIWRESRFQENARGAAGEIGLMQIRSAAAGEWAQAAGVRDFSHEHLIDPTTNILAGTWYLAKLTGRYGRTDNAPVYGLADYNAGRTHVLRWMNGAARTNSALFLEQLDFPGTRLYIEAVLEKRAKYQRRFPH